MIDTHCHLFCEDYENLDELIKNMKGDHISAIVNGCDYKSNEEAIALSVKYSNIYAAIGFHPENIDTLVSNYIEYIEKNIDKIVAIGEIGLDYHWTKDNKKEQIELFENQLKLAEKYNKPVIVHSRDAIEDTFNILKKYKAPNTERA